MDNNATTADDPRAGAMLPYFREVTATPPAVAQLRMDRGEGADQAATRSPR
jgi:hypothetical protein